MSEDHIYQFVLYRSRRALEPFVQSTKRFMQRYQPAGAGPVQLYIKVGGESRFDYLTLSRWSTEDFFKSFKNGAMPMGSARIEQAGGYFLVDQKGEDPAPQLSDDRCVLGFQGELTEEMMKPLMEKAEVWRIFKGVARNSFYNFIWEGRIGLDADDLDGLTARD